MNLKFNKKNYKSNLVEFSDDIIRCRLKFIFFYFIILYIRPHLEAFKRVSVKIFILIKMSHSIT